MWSRAYHVGQINVNEDARDVGAALTAPPASKKHALHEVMNQSKHRALLTCVTPNPEASRHLGDRTIATTREDNQAPWRRPVESLGDRHF